MKVVVTLVLASIAASIAAFNVAAENVVITNIPHVRQSPDFCGEACVAMALNRLGYAHKQNDVFDASGLDPLLGRGCYARELATAMMKIGFEPGTGWTMCSTNELARTMMQQWNALVADLRIGIPSIVCMYFDDSSGTTQHFRLITGYDDMKSEVIFHDPALDDGAYRRMPLATFQKLWPLKTNTKNRCLIRFACRPKKIEKSAPREGRLTNADYAQRMMELMGDVPGLRDKFEYVIEPPFIVLGDVAAPDLQRYAEKTVRWAVTKLKQDFFPNEPDHVIAIWLFKNAVSYTNNTKMLVGHEPTTIYGFYDSEHRALIMNIRTGGGTLVHEIVHPFMAANFPGCPSWFNEGLASLYEQASEKDGHIIGLTNWRLRGLKDAISEKRLSTFKQLTATTEHGFYNLDTGDNYAQARYLCYYLQQRGQLVKFYRDFVKNYGDDPTGYRTLTAVLGEKDMTDFQRRWEKYVGELHFP